MVTDGKGLGKAAERWRRMLAAVLAENRGVALTASSLASHRDLDGFHGYPEKQNRDRFRRTFSHDETRISRILGEFAFRDLHGSQPQCL
jgi:hypothetical protein